MIPLVIRSLVPIFFSSASLKAQQKATIQLVDRTLTTYPFSDPDPVARPCRIYPYFRFDGYTNIGRPQQWKMVTVNLIILITG